MKKIIIHEYLTFVNSKDKPKCEPAYKTGYWNVFKYSQELEDYLKKENIDHTVKAES